MVLLSELKIIIIKKNKKNIAIHLLINLLATLFAFSSNSQSTKINVTENKGNIVGVQNITKRTIVKAGKQYRIYNYADKKAQGQILKIENYVDLKKPVTVVIGTNSCIYSSEYLQTGQAVYPFISCIAGGLEHKIRMDTTSLKLQVVRNHLLITSKSFPFDEKPFTLSSPLGIDNNIIDASYKKYIIDKGIEVRDSHNIPLFQLYLDKTKNAIVLNGVFFFDNNCLIIGEGVTKIPFHKNTWEMTQLEKDSILHVCQRTSIKMIKPIQ